MRNLLILMLIVGAGWYWKKTHAQNEISFDKSGKPVVVLFTAPQCGEPCQSAARFLRERAVPFQENQVVLDDENDSNTRLWKKYSNGQLPVTLIGNNKVLSNSKWEMIAALGQNFGQQYLNPAERTYFSKHFDASGKPKVALYGTDWCPSCAQLRADFKDNQIAFVDIDVEKSGEFNQMTRVMEIPGYPATWYGYTRVHGTSISDVKDAMAR
ncbi:glutaredoxin family protein [Undibacterium sp. JH2W]|uniref:glutaredoxin family protein n=1 Tax=Undibacterium sp. JH2W TaxID=3413037 RepID=UPI003BF1B458